MKQNIKAFIYPEDDGYVVECPDVNVATQGDTLDEAIANLREAIGLALEGEDPATYGLVSDPPILVTIELGRLNRVTPYDPAFERQMKVASKGMKKYRNALRELAK